MQYGLSPVRQEVADGCESLRAALADKWLGADEARAWTPKCDIVLHPNDASYVQAVGAGGASTVASAMIDQQKGTVRQRRIDVRATDPQWQVTALPHELTHVILSDRFAGQRLPRWADEGLAILADPVAKQDGHLRDLQRALDGRTAFRVVELLSLEDYPPANRWGAFYGQSVSLTRFLVQRGSPEQFVDFVQLSQQAGYEAALRDSYQIASIAELERQWSRHLEALPAPVEARPSETRVSEVSAKAGLPVSRSASTDPNNVRTSSKRQASRVSSLAVDMD